MAIEKAIEVAKSTVVAMSSKDPFLSFLMVFVVCLLIFCIYTNLNIRERMHEIQIQYLDASRERALQFTELSKLIKSLKIAIDESES